MAAYTSQYQNAAFPEDDHLFDDDPLALSNFEGGGLDDILDLNLDDSARFFDSKGNDAFERLFGDKPDEFDRMFLDGSTRSNSGVMMKDTMDIPQSATAMEFDNMRFDSINQEIPPSYAAANKKKTGKRGRRRASQPAPYKPEAMDVASFDPAPYIPSNNPTKVVSNAQPRRSSENDLAMFDDIHTSYSFTPPTINSSYAAVPVAVAPKVIKAGPRRRSTLDSTHGPSLAQLLGHTSRNSGPQQECENTFEYHEALQKLAESMKRTELSRRQVLMQRTIPGMGQQQPSSPQPTHHQAQAATSACQLLQHRVSGSNSPTTVCSNVPSRVVSPNHLPNVPRVNSMDAISLPFNNNGYIRSDEEDRCCNMAAFLSGSRGTLTNGLEQSRTQLKMYAAAYSKRTSF